MKTRKTLLTTVIAVAIGTFTCFTYAEDKEGERKGKPGERPERGEGGHPSAIEIFKKVDANDDGKIGPKELADSRPFADSDRKDVAEAFGRWDRDGDGSIGPKEFKEGMERRREAMKGRGKGGPGKGGKGGPKGDGEGERPERGEGERGEGKGKGGKGKGGKGDKS